MFKGNRHGPCCGYGGGCKQRTLDALHLGAPGASGTR